MNKKTLCFMLFLFLGITGSVNAEQIKAENIEEINKAIEKIDINESMSIAQMLSAWVPFKKELKITDEQAKQLSQLQLDFQKKMLAIQQANLDMQQKMLNQNYDLSNPNSEEVLNSTISSLDKLSKDIESTSSKLKKILTKEQYDKLKKIDFSDVLKKQTEAFQKANNPQ